MGFFFGCGLLVVKLSFSFIWYFRLVVPMFDSIWSKAQVFSLSSICCNGSWIIFLDFTKSVWGRRRRRRSEELELNFLGWFCWVLIWVLAKVLVFGGLRGGGWGLCFGLYLDCGFVWCFRSRWRVWDHCGRELVHGEMRLVSKNLCLILFLCIVFTCLFNGNLG